LATEFSTLTTASSTWLEDINRITNHVEQFMQLCGPAGTLVALGFDLAFSVKFYILNNYIFVKIKILLIIVNYV